MSFSQVLPIVFVVFVFLFSCNGPSPEKKASNNIEPKTEPTISTTPKIGICYDEVGIPYRSYQSQLLQSLLNNTDKEFTTRTVDAKGDGDTQSSQVMQLVELGAKTLVIFVVDAESLDDAIKKAKEHKVLTICIGDPTINKLDSPIKYIVDETKIGKMAGVFIIDRLKLKAKMEGTNTIKGDILEVTGYSKGTISANRSAGFAEVIKKQEGVKIVHQAVGLWNEKDAASRFYEAMRLQPNICAVYCHNDAMAYGCWLASQKNEAWNNILIFGTDGVAGPSGGINKVQNQYLAGTVKIPLLVEDIHGHLLKSLDGVEQNSVSKTVENHLVTISNSFH